MATMNIKGVELELDLLDADVMEKYENLNKKVIDDIGNMQAYEGLSTAQSMKKQCSIIDGFIDGLFGEGTAEKCFNGSHNLGDRMDAFGQIAQAANNMESEVDKISARYGVGRVQNREARRFQQNHRNRNHGRR